MTNSVAAAVHTYSAGCVGGVYFRGLCDDLLKARLSYDLTEQCKAALQHHTCRGEGGSAGVRG